MHTQAPQHKKRLVNQTETIRSPFIHNKDTNKIEYTIQNVVLKIDYD